MVVIFPHISVPLVKSAMSLPSQNLVFVSPRKFSYLQNTKKLSMQNIPTPGWASRKLTKLYKNILIFNANLALTLCTWNNNLYLMESYLLTRFKTKLSNSIQGLWTFVQVHVPWGGAHTYSPAVFLFLARKISNWSYKARIHGWNCFNMNGNAGTTDLKPLRYILDTNRTHAVTLVSIFFGGAETLQ